MKPQIKGAKINTVKLKLVLWDDPDFYLCIEKAGKGLLSQVTLKLTNMGRTLSMADRPQAQAHQGESLSPIVPLDKTYFYVECCTLALTQQNVIQ